MQPLLVLASICATALCASPALAAGHAASWVVATASPQAQRFAPFGASGRARAVAIARASAAASGRSSTTAPHASQLTGGETGEISGTVTDASTTNPVAGIAGIEVCAYTPEEPGVEEPLEGIPTDECTTTGPGGEYLLKEVPVGSYDVEFSVSPESTLDYVTQYYENSQSPESVKLVTVKAAEVSTGVDAALTPGGRIAGTVLALSTQAPLAQIVVCAFKVEGFSERCSTTNANGEYELATLASGSYEVIFLSSGEYQLAEQPAMVTAPGTTAPIDAQLSIEVPIDVKPPVISGSAVEGQTLTFAHGVWENSPTSYLDEWGLCGAGGAITTCHTVATGSSFTLTAADVGHTIRVREYASNASGESAQPGISLATGLVSASAPVVLPVVPTAVAVTPAVTPKSGVEASTASAPSRRQLEAVLLSALTPKGKSAKIGALLAHKGYAVTLHVLAAGQATISWYATPKAAHAKQVLVASGRIGFTRAGTTKITIKLTSKGRALLAQSSQLTLSAKGTITATGQRAVAITKRFAAKR
jgi:hypothetical protein